MASKLLLAPWLMTILYSSIPLFWFAIHPLAPRWRQLRRSPYLFLLPMWAAIIAMLGIVAWPWREFRLYTGWWHALAAVPACLLWSSSLRIYRRIGPEFGLRNFIGETELRSQQSEEAPVTHGLHARMRHPIYFAHLMMMSGWAVVSGLASGFALLAVSLLCTFPLMVRMEERELEKRFGGSYMRYKRSVPLLPWFGRKPAEERA
ncbi:MAG TPA: methyltransferase [Candidatus Angelobacter sp.]|nr:methyltransferase [Candidatus Angelobacter sp.]